MPKINRLHSAYAFLAVLAIMALSQMWATREVPEPIPYSEFRRLLADGEVAEVTVGEDSIEGTYKEPRDGKRQFVTRRVPDELAEALDDARVRYSAKPESSFLPTLLMWFLPLLPLVLVWMFLLRRMSSPGGPGGGLVAVGKSKAKVYVEDDTKVTFADVAGVDEAKGELSEIVEFLKNPEPSRRLGARLPKGILLVGPPGTGKTLLARAVAGEAGVPFFSISGSEFVEMFVGVGAARVRDLFAQARTKSPCIVFIDELDALGRARGANPLSSHDEKEQTLNQLLVELDGFDPRSGIVLLAATNRPEMLDPALLRAGRFDRQVLVDRPDRRGRHAILKVHARKVPLAPEVVLEEVAAMTPGFTGADLANLVNEAALGATRRGADALSMEDFNAAIERIVAGLERKNRLLNPREREIVAHHEMGHTLVAAAIVGTDPVHKVSIIPRGIGALGYTIQRPTEDRYIMTRDELEAKLAVLLGGRAAERVVFDHLSTGAADDLARATDIARNMVTRYGMVPELGNVTYDAEPSPLMATSALPGMSTRNYSEATAREIDSAVRSIVDAAYVRAHAVLEQKRAVLDDAARALLAQETLDERALAPFFERMRAP